MQKRKTADDYFSAPSQWKGILTKLREIALTTELQETVKWGMPTYTLAGKNVIGIGACKSYSGIWFFNGVFLKDKQNKLINAQEGVTKALRQWRFISLNEIEPELIKAYIDEAINNQHAGKKIKPVKNRPLFIPELLADVLAKKPKLKNCFQQFSLSKQREFADYLVQAKKEATKIRRLAKIEALILAKTGLNDKYK
ncbi:MAG: DUF1801 domain-containing protein [SAR324 cluster bacterium]|nr:DUF1801 domain-containing protein [SAR324 cluster bacterium]